MLDSRDEISQSRSAENALFQGRYVKLTYRTASLLEQ